MSNYARLIEIFEKLVGFRTVTGDQAAAAACLTYIESLLAPLPLHIDRYRSNDYHSLVVTTQPTRQPKVFLQAHLDVVPGAEHLFTLEGEDNRLVGRGAYDMKYAAACYLFLMLELGPHCAEYDIGLMFTTDEEQDGLNGVDYLLNQGYGCEICLLPDGGDNWKLESAAKGIWLIDVAATGVSAHGSRPWQGENAATKIIDFARSVARAYPNANPTDTTAVLSGLQAGEARNQVPDRAVASFDIRFMNQVELKAAKAKLTRLAARYGLEITNERFGDAIELDVTLPLVQEWESIVRSVRGDQATDGYGLSFGASDARFFAARGIPCIVTRPDGGGMHADDEWIDEASLYQFHDCIRQYVKTVAGVQNSGRDTT